MKEKRINLSDNLMESITKLSEGNPGALNVLMGIVDKFKNDTVKVFSKFSIIDTMNLYGSNLYMLWNDCCGRDLDKTLKIIDYYCDGKITDNDINERIKNVGYGKNFDDLLKSE
ncbi:MAG: hypothetical protein VZQ62_00385 [Methanosphaera sp.]|nr:hypothetical protein [Methanosphaera sp.]